MNVSKQVGATDCALFAMATVISLALGDDPVAVVYDQQQLWSHFLGKCFEVSCNRTFNNSSRLETFPIS